MPVDRLPFLTPIAFLCLFSAACGAASAPAVSSATQGGPTLHCPAPVGSIAREDCTEIAEDFGALSVAGALQHTGSGRDAEPRIEAIRAAGALANSLKEQRVELCESYNKCQVSRQDHAAKDQLFAGAMRALIDLWNKRQFSGTDEVLRFRASIRSLEQRVNGDEAGAGEVTARVPKSLRAEDALGPVEGPGLMFKTGSGVVTVTAQGTGSRYVLSGRPEVIPLANGRHYRIKVTGSYAATSPALVKAGDEVVVRLKYRAAQAGEMYAALRSLEDAEGSEAIATWQVAAGEKGAHEAKLTADPNASGIYLGVGMNGSAAIDLDDVELVRGGQVIAAARAEKVNETAVKTDCTRIDVEPLSGSKSLRCSTGSGDRVTIGMPEEHLFIAIRGPSGDRSILRTLSLEGGRSIDALMKENGQFVIGLVGAGSATIDAIEVTELPR